MGIKMGGNILIHHKVLCNCPGRCQINLRRDAVLILKKYTPVPNNPDEGCLDNIAKGFVELYIKTLHEGVLTSKEINDALVFEFYRWFCTYLARKSKRYETVIKYNDYSYKTIWD